MALDEAGLESDLTEIFEDLSGKSAAEKAAEMTAAISKFVKTGSVAGVDPGSATIPVT